MLCTDCCNWVRAKITGVDTETLTMVMLEYTDSTPSPEQSPLIFPLGSAQFPLAGTVLTCSPNGAD